MPWDNNPWSALRIQRPHVAPGQSSLPQVDPSALAEQTFHSLHSFFSVVVLFVVLSRTHLKEILLLAISSTGIPALREMQDRIEGV